MLESVKKFFTKGKTQEKAVKKEASEDAAITKMRKRLARAMG